MSFETTDQETEFGDELTPGTKLMLGQYTIETFIAAGGFGITYLATDSLERSVVVKECFPGSFCRRQNHSVIPRSRAHQNDLKSIVRLFSLEAMNLAKAQHPNIVGVHQVFEENNTAYMALDYVQGRDLLDILHEDPGSLTPPLVESYLTKMLGAIKHIHALGILHRDISPDNIIVDGNGEPILIDFGAARQNTSDDGQRKLSALHVVKDGYSPQEFYVAGSQQTESSDLYSLAASFYHIITGTMPPDSQVRLSARASGDQDPYVPLAQATDGYSDRFCAALDKAMAILPKERMQNAEEWLDHLSGKVAAPVAPLVPEPETKSAKSFPLVPILGSTALAAALGAGFYVAVIGFQKQDGEAGSVEFETTEAQVPAVGSFTPRVLTEFTQPARASEQMKAPDAEEPPILLASIDPDGLSGGLPPVSTLDETAQTETLPTALGKTSSDGSGGLEPPEKPELAEVQNVVTNVAQPSAPIAGQQTDVPLTGILRFEPRRDRTDTVGIDIAMLGYAHSEPLVDLMPPRAPAAPQVEDQAITENTAVGSASDATFDNPESAVAFFVAMDKEQPKLAAQAPVSSRAEAADTEAPADAEVTVEQTIRVTAQTLPNLPFTLADWDPGLIVGVSEDAPNGLAPNSRIVTINGEELDTTEAIRARLAELAEDNGENAFDVSLGISTEGIGTYEQVITVPMEQHVTLSNGLRFVVREREDGWATEVLEAPGASNFQAGDRLLYFVSTWEDLDQPGSLQSILEREIAAGTSSFGFSVSREDQVWVETLELSSL